MKKLILLLCLVSPLSMANNETCYAMADVVYVIAQQRNSGVSIYEMRNRVIMSYETPRIRDAVLELVEAVYKQPWNRPEEEATMFRKACDAPQGDPA